MSRATGSEIYIGLMSGTSLDGVDVSIVDFSEFPPRFPYSESAPYPASLREKLLELRDTQQVSLHELYTLDAELGELYAERVMNALSRAGLENSAIRAIGCHGQTIRHNPDSAPTYSAQIGDPNRIAAITGIDTVGDFRRKDIALGGQGAPLAPAFHRFLFRSDEEDRVVINIGGIANITLLPADAASPVTGFDTGPGNVFSDYWIRKNGNGDFDDAGGWARGGKVIEGLLLEMISTEAYFGADPPKTTGTEYFGPAWLERFPCADPGHDARDVQATLLELTARTIAESIGTLSPGPPSCFVCGGGARNGFLLERLERLLPESRVDTTESLGLDPDFVESVAFAWLARERLEMRCGNIPSVTRARHASLLGGVYPAD